MNTDKQTIVVAMSGGVDSSVAAAMLQQKKYNVIGVTLQLYDHGISLNKSKTCCASQDIYDAKMVADRLGFPHYIFNYKDNFKKEVIDNFTDSYIRGETPMPCIRCNQSVKFRDLLKAAKVLKADALATGHYVKKIQNNGINELHQGDDKAKDQSYFLFSTTQSQLDYLLFPIGDYNKEEIRKVAQELGLAVANKPDSQDICFIPDGNYRNFINKVQPNANIPGRFIHTAGFALGQHKGIVNYTVGQRKGLGISYNTPLYVIRIDPITNTVYVGDKSALIKTQFMLKDINWLASDVSPYNLEVFAKIRSTTPGVKAKINMLGNNKIKVSLLEKETAITPGQACVFYHKSRILGGGWITREIK